MPKKTTAEFKAAFKTIKKPKRPDHVTSKDKGALDKAIDKTTDFSDPAIMELAQALYDKDEDYMVDLIAYKFAKHFESGSEKRPLWVKCVPKEAFEKALKKVVPDDMSSRLTQVTLERAVQGKGDQSQTIELIRERDPQGVRAHALVKWRENKGKPELQEEWGKNVRINSPTEAQWLLDEIASKDDPEAARMFGYNISQLRLDDGKDYSTGANSAPFDHDTIRAIAAKNPKLFASQMLPGLKQKGNDFVVAMSDPALRKLLAEQAPKEWKALVAETPMLSLLETFEKTVETEGLTDPAEIVDEMFDAIVNNRGIPLAYYTVSFDSPAAIFTGGTEEEAKSRNAKKAVLGPDFPDLPATQCHSLLHLVEDMMGMCPGLTKPPKITQGTIDNMLLTAKLSTMKGKGLLDKAFGGNVFDDAGVSVDQVLFTGNEKGESSHSWVVIDGEPYDPVMGTRGADVANSVDEKFDWLIVDRVAKGNKNRYIIKGRPVMPDGSPRTDIAATPKPQSNKMGFSTGYRLTTSPQDYLSTDELKTAGLDGVTTDTSGEGL